MIKLFKSKKKAPKKDKGLLPFAERFDEKQVEKVLGECHDGEDYKILLKDGMVTAGPK